MRRYTEAQILRLGAITVVVMLVVMAAAFNLSKFPGFAGGIYHAEFSDASGLHAGNMVQVAGMRVGRVKDVELHRDTVLVTFEVDKGVEFGQDSRASIEVLNLLGEKYLELTPEGTGQLGEDDVIPKDRTQSAYDIVGVFGDLTTTTERIDTDQLKKALNVVSDTMDASSPQIHASLDGISRLSETVASRDEEIQSLLASSRGVTKVLAARSDDLVDLMGSSDLVFQEIRKRKAAIHRLLVNARQLAVSLKGIADDNRAEIGSALADLHQVTSNLRRQKQQLEDTIHYLGPYASVLINVIGTGPWFDAYVPNLVGMVSGEFVPGRR
jgi:phospholipid/cholesterol/gamma-HCH transport system substrate-binding protein